MRIINETIADTNYVKDNRIPFYNLQKVLKRWFSIYIGSNIIILIVHIIGNLQNLMFTNWYFSIVRILYIVLFIFALIVYFYQICKIKMTNKEKDFLKLYVIVPILLSFSKLVIPISYYINTDILLNLINSLSLDLITLVIGSLLLKNYFKDKIFNYFIIYNIVVCIIHFFIMFNFQSIVSYIPIWLVNLYNWAIFFNDYGIYVLIHFIILYICLGVLKSKDEYIH